MSNPTKLIGYNLWVSAQYRQKSLNRLLKEFDLTHAQYMVLQYLSRADSKQKLDGLSQNQIAKDMNLDPMMISNVLRLLEKKWYIVRTKATAWAISNTLWLSKLGDDVVKKAHEVVLVLEKTLFESLGDKKLKKSLKGVIDLAQ